MAMISAILLAWRERNLFVTTHLEGRAGAAYERARSLFMRRPLYLRRPGMQEDGTGCRWILGWHVMPGVYVTMADWQYATCRERKFRLDIGQSEPAPRQLSMHFTTLRKDQIDR